MHVQFTIPEGLFGLLPAEVMSHILHLLCQSADKPALNKDMASLRRSSRGLKAATNSATLAITFQNGIQFQNAVPFLSKLTTITDIVLFDRVKTSGRRLDSFSPKQPAPPRFTDEETELATQAMRGVWSQRLQKLELHAQYEKDHRTGSLPPAAAMLLQSSDWLGPASGQHPEPPATSKCAKAAVQASGSSQGLENEDYWHPDLPALKSLTIKHCSLRVLDLSSCPALRELALGDNKMLAAVNGLSLTRNLRAVHLTSNNQLTVFDLSGCSSLLSLTCEANLALASLGLQGCASLQHLRLDGNGDLTSVDLSSNTSLQILRCFQNHHLASIRVPISQHLTSVECRCNASLIELILPRQPALQTLDCRDNTHLVALDISGCMALRSVNVSGNDRLAALKLIGLTSLERLICTGNSVLEACRVLECTALKVVECNRNIAMTALDFAHCSALTDLVCVGNTALTSLNLAYCSKLQVVDQRWCGKLGAVDTLDSPLVKILNAA